MANSQSGHIKNMLNFDTLLTYLKGYDVVYNPYKPDIKLLALLALQPKVHAATATVIQSIVELNTAVANRSTTFAPLGKLITRIKNAEKASGSSLKIDNNIKLLVNTMRGVRSTAKSTPVIVTNANAVTANGSSTTTVPSATVVSLNSTSQLDYDTKLANFNMLIKSLIDLPNYQPNEAEITSTALTAYYNDLLAMNEAVIIAQANLSNANIARYEICYIPNSGMVYLTDDVKSYIKSLYGAVSPQFKQISKLTFKKYYLV